MKSMSKVWIAIFALMSVVSAEKMVFDLRAQDFDKSLTKSVDNAYNAQHCIDARYAVSKDVTLNTNLILHGQKKSYTPCIETSGYFNMVLNQPIQNFLLIINVTYVNEGYGEVPQTRTIKLTDINGKALVMKFNKEEFYIDEKKFVTKIGKDLIALTISNQGEKLHINIDGAKVMELEKLSALKFIDTSFYVHSYFNNRLQDELNALKLVSFDK
jgi:hypothetical protein